MDEIKEALFTNLGIIPLVELVIILVICTFFLIMLYKNKKPPV